MTECAEVPSVIRKVKKKQVKDEMDRLKKAEKKKRRLEKALATSAAIISELEKKKQKMKEEQQRLDEEGAAIAEAVALNVLLGEDSNNSGKIMLKNDGEFKPWDYSSHIDLYMSRRAAIPYNYFTERVSDVHRSGWKPNDWGNGEWSVSSGAFGRNHYAPCFDEGIMDTTEISAGLIAAQAVSSLRIAEDSRVGSLVFNRLLRG